jgi:hypothetical protein
MPEKQNKQADKIQNIVWIKKNGQLVIKNGVDESLFQALVKGLREGACIFSSFDFADDNGTLAQISKLKAGTRALAKETGHTFIEIEQEIKKNAGLYNEVSEMYASFGNASRESLSNAIQVMIEIGEQVGLNLNK